MRLTALLAILLAPIALVAGCGQTGPLYMPGEPAPGASPVSVNTAETEAVDESGAAPAEIGEDAPDQQD